ncbi:ribonuclease H-like domain-containing protein [Tanacetum coccineum]
MAPRAVLMKTGLKTVNTARPVNTVRSVNTGRPFSTARSFNTVRPSYTAHPKSTVHCARPRTYFQNQAQSTVHRPFYKRTTLTKRSYNQNVNTGRQNVNTVRARGFNASNSQLNDKGFVDSGCSRHMTGNIAHLLDFKDFDGGYVTFGGGAYGGRITGTELKFNLFSVSQMCDKKNYVLFTDSECLVLSPNFKLPDENQILLKIPRQDNMYSFDMKNIVPKDSLTCLVAKATSEESMLWHRRLGHINFKNINKLVKENLVRDLPLKRFKNDQTCVACLKGKQHRASSEGFHQVINFLDRSHICYALTKKPYVYIPFIKQFWRSAEATNDDNGEVQIIATIDGHSMTITEASLRRHLMLDDHDSITSIPNSKIFEQLTLMGYHTDSDNPKKTVWEQFSSNIATVVICLATNRRYNFSRLIFEHMVSNISSPHKFLIYPRFIQICLDMQRKQLQQHSRTYHVPSLSIKVFNNMKRPTKGYSGQDVVLFPTMLNVSEPSTLPSRISSSPSHSTEPSIDHPPDHTTTAGKELETKLKAGSARKRAWVVLSKDDEDVEDDSSKQGKKLSDAEVQEKASTETKPIIQEVTPTKVIQDQGSIEKGNSKVSTVGATKVVSTAEVNISTAGRTVTYRRRSEEKRTRKDKGKAIMTETEPKKKSKKELEQERLSFAEEQRAQIARDEEIARQWDEEEGQRAMSKAKSSKKIDWNDPSVIRYHALKMKPKTIAQARRNMVWDFNQHIEPMDLEHGSERMKSPKKIEKEDVDTQKEMKEVSKESRAKRKKSLPRKSIRSTVKRQKMELDHEKEDLKGYLDIVPREDVAEDVVSLSTKYPIVDWKTYVLTENFMYYQIFRGDSSSKNYKVLSGMLEYFDRQDVMDLHRLVKERYSALRPEGYDLMLWGDLHTLFEPDEEDEIWKNQHEYNLISWSLCDLYGVHILLMQNGIAINMLTEKKYPLSQEKLSKMLSKRLEVDHESTQAYKLLKFIRSQVQK